ncbi:MAG TPA: AI-2E family transporter, partial [Anaerolineae bacterium]|nr:AI-2E family transporter [Anaerolineae bacterium]
MNLKHFFRIFIPLVIGASILFVAFKLFSLLWPFLGAYVLFFIFKPFVNLLEQRGLNHTLSVILIFIAAFGILLLLFIFLIPAVASEVSNIQYHLDGYIKVLTGKFDQIKTFLSGFSIGLSVLFDEKDISSQVGLYLKDSLVSFFKSLPAFIFNVIPIILYFFVIPFATFFYLYDEVKIKKKIIGLVPNRYFETTLLLLHNLNLQFGLLLRGMFTSAFIISLLSSAGLWMIDLEYPIIIGIF